MHRLVLHSGDEGRGHRSHKPLLAGRARAPHPARRGLG